MKVGGFFGDLGGTRTHGPLIKSQLLYQLSYATIFFNLQENYSLML